jgi:hypothetical protein
MKRTTTILLISFLALFVFSTACQKNELPANQEEITGTYQPGITLDNGSIQAGEINLTAPATVNVNESFQIAAEYSCGRAAIDRGYILAQDGITKIYKDLTCATTNLLWEQVVALQCYTTDINWTTSLPEAGTYVYRTRHLANDGNCDGLGGGNTLGNCSFTGTQFYCFMIEAILCQTSFSGEAISCGSQRQAVYTFSSADDISYVKIQGGLTNFTGADAVITIVGGNMTATQWTPGGSTNRIIRIEGSVGACQDVIITITWNSTNSGGIITGTWSAKDADGNDIAPEVPGLSCGG